jgi:hypothetical protein
MLDGPDRRFAEFCLGTFKCASEASRPTLDEVDAYITWSSFSLLRRRYRRLLLPFRDPTGCDLLLSATIEDPSINLLHVVA